MSVPTSWHPGTDLNALAILKTAHCPDGTQAGDHMWPLGEDADKPKHFSVNCAKTLISGSTVAASSQFQSAHNARRQLLRHLDEYWLSLEVRVWCAWFWARPSSHQMNHVTSFTSFTAYFWHHFAASPRDRETQTFEQVQTGIVVLLSTYERACALAALRIIDNNCGTCTHWLFCTDCTYCNGYKSTCNHGQTIFIDFLYNQMTVT